MNLNSTSTRRLALELLAASFIVLFQELTLIRWMAGQVRVLAYFPNLILVSSFLGLGLGCLRSGRRPLKWLWPASLLAMTAATIGMSRIIFTQKSATDHLWLLYYDLPPDSRIVDSVQLPIIIAFLLSTASFIPLGQIVAQRLQEFQKRSSSLWGYCWDIGGSLLGVIGFAAACFARSFPVCWFAVFLSAGALFFTEKRKTLLAYLTAAAAVLVLVAAGERAQSYSPYYALKVEKTSAGITVLTNGSLHQYALGLNRSDPGVTDYQTRAREGYHLPYRLLGKPPRRALVLGAGTGNDVAVLLDEGAQRVDAVEIDPGIISLGKSDHPDHPYSDPRVHVYNTDARSFLHAPGDPYDLIIFGTLDSMTRLSALSNVRLDNFVYTLDCVRAARGRLTPDGGIVMFFMAPKNYIDQRLMGMLTKAFDEVPLMRNEDYNLFNRIYLAGPAFSKNMPQRRLAHKSGKLAAILESVDLPTDDWPYLYLEHKQIGGFYLAIIAVIGLIALLSVAAAAPELRRSLATGRGVDWEMFLFGLAFLLLETRSTTQMNLAWGATWLTSAIVFGSILIMVLLATLLVQLRPPPIQVSAAGLALCLLASYFFPTDALLTASNSAKLALSMLFVGGPIFFASACFAELFKERAAAGAAFGWNLLGAVAGGLAEFLSMSLGLKALLLVALLAYLTAALVRLRSIAGTKTA